MGSWREVKELPKASAEGLEVLPAHSDTRVARTCWRIDRHAKERKISRSEAVHALIINGLGEEEPQRRVTREHLRVIVRVEALVCPALSLLSSANRQ
jgi:hypothetical protein